MAKDPLTGVEFKPKRPNQKFISRTNQIIYNNRKAQAKRKAMEFVDKPLHKNHNILASLLGKDKEKQYSRDFLLGRGYDFKFYSHSKKISNGFAWCVYEFAIMKKDNDNFLIIKYE